MTEATLELVREPDGAAGAPNLSDVDEDLADRHRRHDALGHRVLVGRPHHQDRTASILRHGLASVHLFHRLERSPTVALIGQKVPDVARHQVHSGAAEKEGPRSAETTSELPSLMRLSY